MTFFTDDRLRQAAKEAGAILDGQPPRPGGLSPHLLPPLPGQDGQTPAAAQAGPRPPGHAPVACLVLVCLLGSGVFLTTNAQAREAFFGWVSQIVERHRRLYL